MLVKCIIKYIFIGRSNLRNVFYTFFSIERQFSQFRSDNNLVTILLTGYLRTISFLAKTVTKTFDIQAGRDILAFVQEIYTVSRGSIRGNKLTATSNNLRPGHGHKNRLRTSPLPSPTIQNLQNNFTRIINTRTKNSHHRATSFFSIQNRARNSFAISEQCAWEMIATETFILFDFYCLIITSSCRMVL